MQMKTTTMKSQLRRFAIVLEDSNAAITAQDLEGNILAWNMGAEKIYGYTESEAFYMNVKQFIPLDKQKEALGHLNSSILKKSFGLIIES